MNNLEFAQTAESFASVLTCYLYGFWGQPLTQEEYNRVNALPAIHGSNNKFGNQKYIGSGVFPFDCINVIKGILGGATTQRRVDYNAIKNCPIGDCTNQEFLDMMKKDNINPKNAKRGMGLATSGHAAIALGDGRWVDANFTNGQNGVKIHDTGIEQFTCAGRIPGVEYLEDIQVGDIVPMKVYEIKDGYAYGKVEVTVPEEKIVVGSKVTIAKGAVSGGGNPKYANKKILAKYANGKYVDTVAEINTFNGEEQARLQDINTWVAFKYLTVVG